MHWSMRTIFPSAAILGLSLAASLAGPSSASPSGQSNGVCTYNAKKTADPSVLLRGETTTIRLALGVACTGVTSPLHLVVVLDASEAMAGEPSREVESAMKTLISGLHLAKNPTTLVGVVEFNTGARTICRLMNDEAKLLDWVGRTRPAGGSAIDRGIAKGYGRAGAWESGTGPVGDTQPGHAPGLQWQKLLGLRPGKGSRPPGHERRRAHDHELLEPHRQRGLPYALGLRLPSRTSGSTGLSRSRRQGSWRSASLANLGVFGPVGTARAIFRQRQPPPSRDPG